MTVSEPYLQHGDSEITAETTLDCPYPEQLIPKLWSPKATLMCVSPSSQRLGNTKKMCRQLAFCGTVSILLPGKPMLTDFVDYQEVSRSHCQDMPMPQPGEALVLMGHGSDHFSNALIPNSKSTMRYLDMESIFVGTVEGFPNLDFCKRVKKQKISHLTLFPFLIVAGDHAQNDMAGKEESS